MMIEISLSNPLILISFKRGNLAWKRLQNLIYQQSFVVISNFNTILSRSRRIFISVWLFYISYLRFWKFYFYEIHNSWNETNSHQRKVFSAMLLNGGGDIIDLLFNKYTELFIKDDLDFANEQVMRIVISNAHG